MNESGSATTHPTDLSTDRVPRRIWVGLVAAVVYLVVAAGVGNLVDVIAPDLDPVTELAASHLIPLPIAIVAGAVFAWRAGWWHDVWTDPPTLRQRPHRWWLVAIPVVMAVQIAGLLVKTPWSALTAPYILVGLVCYLMVGLGEELYFRGILLESVRGHHGETVTLIVTAAAFGLAHSIGAAIAGAGVGAIAFTVAGTAMEGALFYAALRVTGTLWVPILLHGLGDWARWLVSGDGIDRIGGGFDVATQVILGILAAGLLVSTLREDHRTRRSRPAPDRRALDGDPTP